MQEGRRISPAIIIIPVGLGLGLALVVAATALAAPPTPPPGEYICPYCGATLDTYEELVAHVQTEHPGERIPLPIQWE